MGSTFPSTMSGLPIKRHRTKAIGPDSELFAKAFTHKTVTTTNRSGFTVMKDVLVPLVLTKPLENVQSTSSTAHFQSNEHDMTMEEPVLNDVNENISNCQHKSKVCYHSNIVGF